MSMNNTLPISSVTYNGVTTDFPVGSSSTTCEAVEAFSVENLDLVGFISVIKDTDGSILVDSDGEEIILIGN